MNNENETRETLPSDMDNQAQGGYFLRDVRRLLQFQKEIGIEGYPRTPGLERFIAGQQQAAPPVAAKTAAAPVPDTTLADLYAEIAECSRCSRHLNRTRLINGESRAGIKLMIIGDSPSAEDVLSGVPMSGEPGELLERMLAAIGLNRAAVHLCLLLRCPAQEPPELQAVEACLPFLLKEISLVAPKVICTMGSLAAQKLLHSNKPLSQLRGRFHIFQGIPLMPTFSPEFLLKNQEMKKATWLDLQLIQKKCAEK